MSSLDTLAHRSASELQSEVKTIPVPHLEMGRIRELKVRRMVRTSVVAVAAVIIVIGVPLWIGTFTPEEPMSPPTTVPDTVTTDDEAVEVVQAWVSARNAGNVETVLSLTADDATLLGHSMDLPHRRDDFVELLRAQAAASFATSETDCVVDDELVSCRYQLSDVFLRGLGVALTGDHRYVVRDGLIISAERTHDPEARSNVVNAMREFRSWVKEHYPELETVIWTTRGSTAYSTVDGVQAMHSIFEEYLDSR